MNTMNTIRVIYKTIIYSSHIKLCKYTQFFSQLIKVIRKLMSFQLIKDNMIETMEK